MRAASSLCVAAVCGLAASAGSAQTWFADRSDSVIIAGVDFDDVRLEVTCVQDPNLGPTGFALFLPSGQADGAVRLIVDQRAAMEFQLSPSGFEARTQEEFDRFARLVGDLRAGNRLRVVTSAGEHFLPLRGSSAALEPCPRDITLADPLDPAEAPTNALAVVDPNKPPSVVDPSREVSDWLRILGYDPGTSDPALQQALAEWQSDTGRTVSGGLTAEGHAALRTQAIGSPTWVIDPPPEVPALTTEPAAEIEDYGRVTLADCNYRRGFGRLSYNRGVTSTRPNPTLLTDVCFDEAGGAFVAAEVLDGLTPVPGEDELRKFEILTGDPANRTEVSVGRDAQTDCGTADGEGFILATAPGGFELSRHPDAAWVVGEGYFLETVAAPGGAMTYETAWVSVIPTSIDGAAFWTQFKTGFSGLSLWGTLTVDGGSGETALSDLGTEEDADQNGTLNVSIDADGRVTAQGDATAAQLADASEGEWRSATLQIGPLSGHALDGGSRIIAFGPVSGSMTLGDGQTLELKGDATLQACAKVTP